MIPSVDINYWAILVASIVSMAIGFLWYSPLLFGNAWLKVSGINTKEIEKQKEKGMGKKFFASFVSTLIMTYVLALFLKYMGVTLISEGLFIGFLIWLGFTATISLGPVLWQGKPVKIFLINTSHELVCLLVMSLILTLWV